MRDIDLEATEYFHFTTRAFSTGVPTVLAGTPGVSVLEENNATPITAGLTLTVDRASVVGLNEVTVVATAANGYESGKTYSIYLNAGTVDSVSVVGEIVAQFTVGLKTTQNAAIVAAVLTGTDMAESYAPDTETGTLAELLYMIYSVVAQNDVTTTNITTRKLDGTTQAMVFAMDDAADPTSRNRTA